MKRLFITLGCAAIAAASLSSLWLAINALAPRAVAVMWENDSHLPGYVNSPILFEHWGIFFNVLLTVVIVGTGVSLLRTRFQALAMAALSTATLVSVLLSLYLSSISGIALALAAPDAFLKNAFYEHALDKFAMLQSAKGELESVTTIARETGRLTLVEVEKPPLLTKLDQRIRMRTLLFLLKSDPSPTTRKVALATSYGFRALAIAEPIYADGVLKAAAELGAGDSHDLEGFYRWLGSTLGKDGWNPAPVYKFTYKR